MQFQWEQQNALSAEELQIIESLDAVVLPQQKYQQTTTFIKQSNQRDENIEQLESIQNQYQIKQKQMNDIIITLKDICDQLNQLNNDKDRIISNIKEFHEEATFLINQQKDLMETTFAIQDNLTYYTNLQKIKTDLEQDWKEINFQIINSEIQDGILFFYQKPNYHNKQKCIEQYQALKKKLIGICRNALVKIISKECGFINSKINAIKDLLPVFYPTIQVCEPNPLKLQYLQIIFPQLIPLLTQKQQKLLQIYIDDYNKFYIPDNIRHFFTYIENQLETDNDIYQLYNDVYLQISSFNRFNLHQELVNMIQKQMNDKTALNLVKIKQKLKIDDIIGEKLDVLLFQTLVGYIFEILLLEYVYFRVSFTSNQKITIDNNRQQMNEILDLYYQIIRSYLSKNQDLNSLVMMANILVSLRDFIDNISPQCYIIKVIQDLQKYDNKEQLSGFKAFFQAQFIDKLRIDLMQKLITSSQQQIQLKIYQHSSKEYIRKKGKLIIHKYHLSTPIPKSYVKQRDEVYPAVLNGLELITKMQACVDQKIFSQLAGEVLREINNQLKEVADNYSIKFDSYLFYIKNLAILCEGLGQGTYISKESELNFSESKAVLLQLISGQFKPEISLMELSSAEKLWTYTTNFFQFIYKGMPKLNYYEVDWKLNLLNQKDTILFMFVSDMTFIVAKTLLDFTRKYQYVTQNEQEQAQKDLTVLISVESIKRTYQLFHDNLKDFMYEIILKMNNYLHKNLFMILKEYIKEIIDNSLQILGQFYINVSKHYDGKDYDQFQFQSVDEIREFIKIDYYD
ncbi:hypothetical protein pb186bvf_000041 [Paramecium bursaria]